MRKLVESPPSRKTPAPAHYWRGFLPWSPPLSLALDWVRSAPSWVRPYRIDRAARRLEALTPYRRGTLSAFLWSMLPFSERYPKQREGRAA